MIANIALDDALILPHRANPRRIEFSGTTGLRLSAGVNALPRMRGVPMKRARPDILPTSCPPRGLSRLESAAYIGVSPTLFDEMVRDGRMPQPKVINSRVVWDRHQLDPAFEALPTKEQTITTLVAANDNEWDDMN
jgi:predicted DNA-binding transcriptional regulator AlpA